MSYKEELNTLVQELHKQGYDKLCFLQPAYNVGGGPFVESNIAKYIAKHTDIKVFFCDYKDGYADTLLKNTPEVKMLYYDTASPVFPLQEKAVVFTNSTRAILLQNMNEANKIIFWHYETIPCAWDLVFLNGETKKYLKLLKKENALVYHDWSARNILNRQYNIGFDNDDYVYITLDKKNKETQGDILDKNTLNIGFLSRLVPDKIQSLFYLIKQYAAYPTNKKKRLHIIGDGGRRKNFEEFCKKYASKIEFIFHGTVLRQNLDDCLIHNIDILFAVGTSVLEGAALKIPSASLLMDIHAFEEKDAFWLYHSKNYCVGILKEQKEDFGVQYTSIQDMISSIYANNGKKEIGKKCYDYYVENHSNKDKYICDFLKLTLKSNLTFKKFKRCIRYIPYTNISFTGYKIFGKSLFKVIEHYDKTEYYLFNLRIFKIKKQQALTKYEMGATCVMTKSETKPYKFPTAQWKDNLKQVKAPAKSPVVDKTKEQGKGAKLPASVNATNKTKETSQQVNKPSIEKKTEKFFVSFLGLKFLKVKKDSEGTSLIYFLGLPLFNIARKDDRWNVGFLIFYLIRKSIIKKMTEYKNLFLAQWNYYSKLRIKQRFKTNKKVTICLVSSRPGMFSFNYLYGLLMKDKRFEVKQLIMPDPFYGIDIQGRYIEETYRDLVAKGYTPIKGYDPYTKTYINVRKDINPDIIFYQDFWKPHFVDEFYITHFLDKITFLSDYGFSIVQEDSVCTFELNNIVDIYFRVSEIHKRMAEKLMANKGRNVYVVGAPKLDARFDNNYIPKPVWKIQPTLKKKVIWTPHHSDKMPANMYRYNAFWEIYDYMFEVAERYKDKVQFVFRPHPILTAKLIKQWGREKQEEYYKKWDNLSNGQYYDGDFIDLFMTSDAMITDSCSFRAEYTAFDKPLFLTLTKTSRIINNEFGDMLQEVLYLTKQDLKKEIIQFIDDVVLGGKDTLAKKRHAFVQEYLGKINGKTASENIYEQIVSYLEN